MIFCVEDDPNIRELEVYTLKSTGFPALGLESGDELFKALETVLPQLIILDIMLPGEDGMAILKRLRRDKRTADIPVIMATAKGSEFDKVHGLDSGADDYIAKPFGMMEMVSRVKAVLRRYVKEDKSSELTNGLITMDIARHMVFVNGEEVVLTYKEFEVLHKLMERRGGFYPRTAFNRYLGAMILQAKPEPSMCISVHSGKNSAAPVRLLKPCAVLATV